MNNPSPPRFRFSLGFLLAWVLLTSLFWGLTFHVIGGWGDSAGSQKGHSITYVGQPCTNYLEIIEWDDSKNWNNHRTQYDFLGMSLNCAIWSGFSYFICSRWKNKGIKSERVKND